MNQRYDIIDMLRGVAILMMVVYHLFYDLDYFSLLQIDFYQNPFWLWFRYLIITAFLLIMGMSLVLATEQGFSNKAFLRRLMTITLCAALISIVTHYLFGARLVFFGILHFIALASVLALLTVRLRRFNLVLGVSLIALGLSFQATVFDHAGLQWLGMMTYKPPTEDYVPLLPWLGVVQIGMFFMHGLLRQKKMPEINTSGMHTKVLIVAGRQSLLIYMLHQPLLFLILWLVSNNFAE